MQQHVPQRRLTRAVIVHLIAKQVFQIFICNSMGVGKSFESCLVLLMEDLQRVFEELALGCVVLSGKLSRCFLRRSSFSSLVAIRYDRASRIACSPSSGVGLRISDRRVGDTAGVTRSCV